MRLISIWLLVFIFKWSAAQQIKWNPVHWKLYDSHQGRNLYYPADTLKTFNYISLPEDTMQYFLKNLIVWPKEKTSLWMGAFIASCEINGHMRKIDISVYGGFFYDEKDKLYYELRASVHDQWLAYLNDAFENMPVK